ncbi:MAG TPA: CARDB domain-containing protein [Thermoleophilaceae bacterium]|nr:CARDB domain-containing protein [Thermoleophilaceae bacterium]
MSSRISIVAAPAVALLALALFAAPGASSRAASPKADHGAAQLVECTHGKRAKDRRATFRGEMTQLDDSDAPLRMQLRFVLSERVGRGVWVGLDAPGIGVWREARPGVIRFAYRQRVVALQKGTSYRALVEFRWLSADGKTVSRESERSPVCRQPGKLPNLKVRDSIRSQAGPTEGTRRYVVKVGNTGSVTAQRIHLMLLVDGAEVDTRTIGRLEGGARRSVTFVGPVCVSQVEARIDPHGAIRELTERDNAMSTACPPD